jgi:type II secretion system protein H
VIEIRRHPSTIRRRRGSRGFSLFELTLVVAILAVLAALAAPRYGRASGRYRLELAARRVAADLRLAQSGAKAASASRTVVFTVETDRYQLQGIAAPDGAAGDYTICLADEPYKADLTAAAFDGNPRVVFSGWGLPHHGGTVTLTVGTDDKTVTVDGETGRIDVQ